MRMLLLAVGVVMVLAETERRRSYTGVPYVGCGSNQELNVGQPDDGFEMIIGDLWVHASDGTTPSGSDMDGSCIFTESDIGKITCPMLAALIKNGDLVPQGSGCLIDREQTREAFRAVEIPEEIVLGTTNGNFDGEGTICPTCPTHINPFTMNKIMDGVTGRNTERMPHEHYRSTGIRDTDGNPTSIRNTVSGTPINVFDFAEAQCLCNICQWTEESVSCFASLFDRDSDYSSCSGITSNEFFTSNDVALDQRPVGCNGGCEGVNENPSCLSALHGSIRDLFMVFKGPDDTITRDDWRNIWLEATYPAHYPKTHIRLAKLEDNVADLKDVVANLMSELTYLRQDIQDDYYTKDDIDDKEYFTKDSLTIWESGGYIEQGIHDTGLSTANSFCALSRNVHWGYANNKWLGCAVYPENGYWVVRVWEPSGKYQICKVMCITW